MILHLVSQADWQAAAVDEPYLPKDFAKDGFIHCTGDESLLLQVANSFYKQIPGDFLVLEIDESKVKAEVKWELPASPTNESSTGSGKAQQPTTETVPPETKAEFGESVSAQTTAILFPHIYGPLNRDAIVGMRKIVRSEDGTFTGYMPIQQQQSDPTNPMNLKSPSQIAKELLDATDEFSEAIKRYKDSVEARMDEMDKKIKKL